VIKVNPDSPQRPVRRRVLEAGKRLLMPTPRLRGGFTLVEPAGLTVKQVKAASTIAGAFELGRVIPLDDVPEIDLIVAGTVAVAPNGARVGKGEGYSELEYATLRELGIVDDAIPIATTVHEVQLVGEIPLEPFDVPVDVVVTPTRILRAEHRPTRPSGILWEELGPERLEEMPVLAELRTRLEGGVHGRA
jgi:5-formyltetrahydrofolate cyclo-ligase